MYHELYTDDALNLKANADGSIITGGRVLGGG